MLEAKVESHENQINQLQEDVERERTAGSGDKTALKTLKQELKSSQSAKSKLEEQVKGNQTKYEKDMKKVRAELMEERKVKLTFQEKFEDQEQ